MKRQSTIKIASSIVGLCILGLWSVSSSASEASPGPAPASYGTTSHDYIQWQELDDHSNGSDTYGVTWSVDGGTSWGRDNLHVGQKVKFKFDIHKRTVGTHESDHLKAWLDWNQNGVFDTNEVIAYGEHLLLPSEDGNLGRDEIPNVADFSFYSGEHEITDSFVGYLWLRARVTCSHSLVDHWKDQWKGVDYEAAFASYGFLNQGETEDWKITVAPAPVPVPAAVWLFGSGLIGMFGLSKRKNRVA